MKCWSFTSPWKTNKQTNQTMPLAHSNAFNVKLHVWEIQFIKKDRQKWNRKLHSPPFFLTGILAVSSGTGCKYLFTGIKSPAGITFWGQKSAIGFKTLSRVQLRNRALQLHFPPRRSQFSPLEIFQHHPRSRWKEGGGEKSWEFLQEQLSKSVKCFPIYKNIQAETLGSLQNCTRIPLVTAKVLFLRS